MSDDESPLGAESVPTMTMRQARMLDLRLYICALFTIFGAVVTVVGIRVTPAELAKTSGININLWAGLAMLALAAVFGVWAALIPPVLPRAPGDQGAGDGPS
ncbi:MAG: hypothetical protein WCP28_14705 [Actinomycetes bacterium]